MPRLAEQTVESSAMSGRQFGNWELQQTVDLERVATDLADYGHPGERLGDPDTTKPVPKSSPNGSSPFGSRTDAPRPPRMQHSAKATATPPSATSWALRNAPDRTRARTAW